MILWRIKDIGQCHAIVQDASSTRNRNLVEASLHITHPCVRNWCSKEDGKLTTEQLGKGRGRCRAKKLLTILKRGCAVPEDVMKQGGGFTFPAGVPGWILSPCKCEEAPAATVLNRSFPGLDIVTSAESKIRWTWAAIKNLPPSCPWP